MTLPRKLALGVLSGGTFVTSGLGLLLLAGWTELMPPELPDAVVPFFVVALIGIPAAASWFVGRVLARRWRSATGATRIKLSRRLVGLFMAAYALTVIIGVPAAQSRRDAWAVGEYKKLKASGSARVWDVHPSIQTYAAIPLFPFVILSYHEYQLDGLYGLGAFELALWYGNGVTAVDVLPLWVS